MDRLLDKRLWVVSGKGGVGKSTVSAALALLFSSRGERTLLCEVNAKDRLGTLLERGPVGPQIVPLAEQLWAVNLQPQSSLREYAMMVLKFESIYKAVFENRLVSYFLRFIPSVQELVMLGKILFHVEERLPTGELKYQRVVVDAPATGHAISFFNIPRVLINTVPPGRLAKEAKRMRDLLENPAVTTAILVSLPEEMPVNETIELRAALGESARIQTDLIVLNEYVEERFSEREIEALSATRSLQQAAIEHREQAMSSSRFRHRLLEALGLPVAVVPRLFTYPIGRQAVESVARTLEPALEAPG